MYRPTVAEIHLKNLAHNYKLLTGNFGSDQFFCAMIKCNAYGHGDLQIARTLSELGCQTFGVALVEEGISLRERGLHSGQILVFGTYTPESLAACAEYGLTPVLSQLNDLQTWNRIAQTQPQKIEGVRKSGKQIKTENCGLPYHLELNTGMNRLGVALKNLEPWFDAIVSAEATHLDGVMTHLSTGEDILVAEGESQRQLREFKSALELLKSKTNSVKTNCVSGLQKQPHIYSSSATIGILSDLARSEKSQMWPVGARVGLALYGAQPSVTSAAPMNLKPVMRLRTKIVAIQNLNIGERVSYCGTWQARRATILGVLPIGYGDGYNRGFSNLAEVLIANHRVPLVGNVCMDYVMVDLTDISSTKNSPLDWINEEAVLFGWQNNNELRLEELAQKLKTIPYTLMTTIGERVPREYVE